MKRYTIVIEDTAGQELRASFAWGVRAWGRPQAQRWFSRMIRQMKTLTTLPERCPIAPECDEFAETVRHLSVGRYRILFTVHGKQVHILHVRGAFAGEDAPDDDED